MFLFSVFKRAVILVYRENGKLKKRMVSLPLLVTLTSDSNVESLDFNPLHWGFNDVSVILV